MRPAIKVQREAFDTGAEIARLSEGAGGVASFVGVVRGDGGLLVLELEHFPGMTEKALGDIAAQAAHRWSLSGLTIIHRHGRLEPEEPIVFVGAAARHRSEAIEAMHFAIDWLKTEAPFWKREHFSDGRSLWVEARAADESSRARWT